LKEKRLNYEGLKMIKKYLFRGKKPSLKVKFILVVVFLAAILLVSFSYLASSSIYEMGQRSQDISADSLENQAGEYLMQVTRDNSQKNDQILGDVQKNAETLAGYASDIFESPEVFVPGEYWVVEEHMFPGPEGQYLNSEDELASAFSPNVSEMNGRLIDDLEKEAYMDFIVPHMQKSSPSIVAIYLGTERDALRYYPNIHLGALVTPDFQVTQRPWYLSANEENNPERKVVWSPVYVDATGYGLMITAASPVYINDDEFAGVVGIDVTLDAMTLNMQTARLPGDGYFILVDDDSHAIVLPEEGYPDIIGRPAEEGEFAVDLMSEARPEFISILYNITMEKQGYTTMDANGTELFIAFSKMNNTGWGLVSVVNAESVLQSIAKLQDEMNEVTNSFIFGNILPLWLAILLFTIIIGSILTNHIVRPIQKLAEAAQQVATGKWDDIEIDDHKSEDEIGRLSNSFTLMLSELKKSRTELEEYSTNLEGMVEDRTKELETKVDELERFKKVIVGRELKMVELKNEIKELNTKLKDGNFNDLN